jgi:plastocyanin
MKAYKSSKWGLAGTVAALCSLSPFMSAQVVGQETGITGRVALSSASPDPEIVSVTKNRDACGSQVVVSLIEGENGGLKNAVVRIVGMESQPPADFLEPVLDQRGCLFEPRVVLLAPGQQLDVLNNDGIMHNVHTKSKANRSVNKSMPKFLKKITLGFAEPEVIPVRCDVHSWMHAVIVVAEHGYYAVTQADGSFTLPSLPDGTYTLEAWHPELGAKETTFEVADGVAADVQIVF